VPLPSETGASNGLKESSLKNSSSQGQNLALTVLEGLICAEFAPQDSGFRVSGLGVEGGGLVILCRAWG